MIREVGRNGSMYPVSGLSQGHVIKFDNVSDVAGLARSSTFSTQNGHITAESHVLFSHQERALSTIAPLALEWFSTVLHSELLSFERQEAIENLMKFSSSQLVEIYKGLAELPNPLNNFEEWKNTQDITVKNTITRKMLRVFGITETSNDYNFFVSAARNALNWKTQQTGTVDSTLSAHQMVIDLHTMGFPQSFIDYIVGPFERGAATQFISDLPVGLNFGFLTTLIPAIDQHIQGFSHDYRESNISTERYFEALAGLSHRYTKESGGNRPSRADTRLRAYYLASSSVTQADSYSSSLTNVTHTDGDDNLVGHFIRTHMSIYLLCPRKRRTHN